MRNTKAKQLRAIARAQFDLPWTGQTVYQDKEHKPKLVATGKINTDGTPHKVLISMVTRSLGPCTRQVYQQLKKR